MSDAAAVVAAAAMEVDAGSTESRLSSSPLVNIGPTNEDPAGAKTSTRMNAAAALAAASSAARKEAATSPTAEGEAAAEKEDGCGNDAGKAATSTTANGRRRRESPQSAAAVEEASSSCCVDNNISRGDRPHVNTSLPFVVMTISSAQPTSSEESDAMVVDNSTPPHHENEDTPMNLATNREDEAVNLSNKCHPAGLSSVSSMANVGLSAKMRLKKQRLEAVAKAAAEMNRNHHMSKAEETTMSWATTTITPISNAGEVTNNRTAVSFVYDENHPASALHRLAEAAERKQVQLASPPLCPLPEVEMRPQLATSVRKTAWLAPLGCCGFFSRSPRPCVPTTRPELLLCTIV
jgi:hypothetical protein